MSTPCPHRRRGADSTSTYNAWVVAVLAMGALACPGSSEPAKGGGSQQQKTPPAPRPRKVSDQQKKTAPARLASGRTKTPGSEAKHACRPARRRVSGRLTGNARWCGLVEVVGDVLVPQDTTLTIVPGTRVMFSTYRGYTEPYRRLRLRVEGGRLVARGKPGRLIYFTSSETNRRNGDWSGIELVNAPGSRIGHAVVEFSQNGLHIWSSEVELSYLVIRFNSWEGLHACNGSKVLLHNSRIYANGYNCIDVRNKVEIRVHDTLVAHCGTLGVLVDASFALIEGSIIEGSQEGLYLDNGARATVETTRFAGQVSAAISCGRGDNKLELRERAVFDGLPLEVAVACPGVKPTAVPASEDNTFGIQTGVSEGPSPYLDYIPGNRKHDIFTYLYPPKDETREVVSRVGTELGKTFNVASDGKALWTANAEGRVTQVDPRTGRALRSFPGPGPHPAGITLAGKLLWISDFVQARIYGVDLASGKVREQLMSPDPTGGCRGLAHDGKNLWALGWGTARLYRLGATGKVLSSIPAPAWPAGGGGVSHRAAGGLAWDGETFWAPAGQLIRFSPEGKILGWVHRTAERMWDLSWDGEALWTTQRTNESWTDVPQLFRVKVLKVLRE